MRILESLHDFFAVCYEASCGYGHYNERFHVKIESVRGTDVASRGPTWRKATPLV